MEEQLLPRAELKPVYDEVVWLWVYRDFKEGAADRAAERTAIRFGLSSYPQHFLIDPATLAVLADTTRSLEGFLQAVRRTKVKKGGPLTPAEQMEAAEKRAVSLEEDPAVERAAKWLDDEDLAVRTRALTVLAAKAPETVAAQASALLEIPNDLIRYGVLDVLAKSANPKAVPMLEALVQDPKGSRNPNVLRGRAAKALGACGDAGSLEVLRPIATSGAHANQTTKDAIAAVAAIGTRLEKARGVARQILCDAYPVPKVAHPAPADATKEDAFESRSCYDLVKRVHQALGAMTGKNVALPDTYDAAVRARLVKEW